MRITLLHNPDAGTRRHPRAELVERIRGAGHEVAYRSTDDPLLDEKLADPGDLVLVAGGDGTVADAGRRFVGRRVPLAVLPLGTANNIATALGAARDPQALLAGLEGGRSRRLDVALARGPWGTERWLESAGIGLFGAMLRQEARRSAAKPPIATLADGLRLLRRELARLRPRRCAVAADGVDCSGSFLVLVAMNIACIGPRACLAPQADPADGLLDLAMARAGERRELAAWLSALLAGAADAVAPVEVRRVRRIRIEWDAAAGHVDDRPWPEHGGQDPGWVELAITDPPLTVLLGA